MLIATWFSVGACSVTASFGAHHHLARQLAGREPVHASAADSSSSTSSGSISTSSGSAPDASSSSAAREAVRVVVVRADDRELEHDRPVVVHAGQFATGADEHERARVVELVERGLGGRRVAGALERDRVRLGDADGPSARVAARRASTHARRADRRARSRRAGAGSDTVMSSTPRARSTAVVSSPTGPAPVTSTRSPGATPDRLTVWIAIAVGSVSAAARVVKRRRIREQARGRHDDVAAERAAPERSDRVAACAGTPTGRPRRHARHSPQPASGSATTRVPTQPASTPSPTATTVPAHS